VFVDVSFEGIVFFAFLLLFKVSFFFRYLIKLIQFIALVSLRNFKENKQFITTKNSPRFTDEEGLCELVLY
jgi:hypothetical protein